MISRTGSSTGRLAGTTIDTYKVLQSVGLGGMGEVYRGWDERLGRPVAIKVLHPALATEERARQRFLRETRLACRVVHPYVATVFDVIEKDERLFLVMEYIEGRRLDALVDEDNPTPQEIARLGIEIAEALTAIHDSGLVHRDLKPGNVMVTPAGHVKVMDFGVAYPMAPPAQSPGGDGTAPAREPTLTQEGHGVGTVSYMSPEQIRGGHPDGRSDLFSLGIVLYEALARQHPFMRGSPMATASAILNDAPGSGTNEPRTLTESGPLRNIIFRLLEKSPALRYQSSEEVVADLRAAMEGQPLAGRPARLSRATKIAVAGVVIAAVATIGWRFWPDTKVVPPAIPQGGPALVILPFTGPDRSDETVIRGAMLASMLRSALAESGGVRVVGSSRTEEFLADGAAGSPPDRQTLRKLLAATSARFLVTGRFEREEGRTIAAVEVLDVGDPDGMIGLRAASASTDDLVEHLAGDLGEKLGLTIAASVGGSIDGGAPEAALLAAERGRRATESGHLSEAARSYDEAVASDPTFLRAHLERAKALYRAGYVVAARDAFRQAEREAQRSGKPLPRRLELEVRYVGCRVNEDRDCEIAALKTIADEERDNPESWAELSSAYRSANRPADALEALDQAARLAPSDPGYALRRAATFRQLHKFEEARVALDQAAALDQAVPGNPWASRIDMERGFQATMTGNFAAARSSFEKAAGAFATSGEPLRLAETGKSIADTYILEGNLAEAVGPLRRAADAYRDAGNARLAADCLNNLGSAFLQLGDLPHAEDALRQAWRSMKATGGETPNPDPLINLASLLNLQGRTDEAKAAASEAATVAEKLGDHERTAQALLQLAEGDFHPGRFDAALATYDRMLTLLPANRPTSWHGWARIGLVEIALARGNLSDAQQQADRSVDAMRATNQGVDLAYALLERAKVRRQLGDSKGAADDLKELVAAAGGSAAIPADLAARLALERGLEAVERGNPAAAVPELRKAVSADRTTYLTAPAGGALGLALAGTGAIADGARAARRGVDAASAAIDRVTARNDLAEVTLAAKRDAEACKAGLAAFDEASRLGMSWEIARAAHALAGLPSKEAPANLAEIERSGRDALEKFLNAAPAQARDAVERRPAVAKLAGTLKD